MTLRGNVTYGGAPIENGEIRFYPIDGTQGSVSGGPIKEGHYIAEGRGGVPVGKHRVEIRAYRAPQRTGPEFAEGGPAEQYLPAKYNSNTELTAEVSSSTPTLDFELTK